MHVLPRYADQPLRSHGRAMVEPRDEAVIASMEERWAELHPELEKRIGALWNVVAVGTANVGCEAPAPVRAELGVPC